VKPESGDQRYLVRFTAAVDDPLAPDAALRLAEVILSLPGIDVADRPSAHARSRRVTASFVLAVTHGMADAARDGSRLAKEALHLAGMDSGHLMELVIQFREPSQTPD
jgi:hypothetical protein